MSNPLGIICRHTTTPRPVADFTTTPRPVAQTNLSGKFVQLYQNCARETFGLYHRVEHAFLLWFTSFGLIASFPLYEKITFHNYVYPCFRKCQILSIEQPLSFYTQKGLNATKTSKELDTNQQALFSSLLVSVAFSSFRVKNLMTARCSIFDIF